MAKEFQRGLESLAQLQKALGKPADAPDTTAKKLDDSSKSRRSEEALGVSDEDLLQRIFAHLKLDPANSKHAKRVKDITDLVRESHHRDISRNIDYSLPKRLFMEGEFADTIYDQILQLVKRGYTAHARHLLRQLPQIGVTFAKGSSEEQEKTRKNFWGMAEALAEKAGQSLEDIAQDAGIDFGSIPR